MFQRYHCVLKIAKPGQPFVIQDLFFDTFRGSRVPSMTFSGFDLYAYQFDTRKVNQKFTDAFENAAVKLGAKLIFSTVTSPQIPVCARFFGLNFRSTLFIKEKEILIKNIEQTLGKKLKMYTDVFGFVLSQKKIAKPLLVQRLDELLLHPAVVSLVKIDTPKETEMT